MYAVRGREGRDGVREAREAEERGERACEKHMQVCARMLSVDAGAYVRVCARAFACALACGR
eukprot:1660231-Pleurochrysis_carterae.AAC.1